MNTRRYGIVGAIWAIGGIVLLLSAALYRLTPYALELTDFDLTTFQVICLVLFILFMAVAEGYKGFQRKFSPRFAARTKYLLDHPSTVRVLLAPMFSMGYFQATRRVKITSISVTLMVIILIIAVKALAQPWRGIVDAGVIFGLLWGLLSILILVFASLTGRDPGDISHLPEK